MNMKFTLHQLTIFKKLVQLKSFSKTAVAMHMTQPGISTQIKQLSDNLSINLVEVIGKKVFISDDGYKLLKHIENIQQAIDTMCNDIITSKGVLNGIVKIGIDPSIETMFFKPIAQFMVKYPQVQVDVNITDKDSQIERLENETLDIGTVGARVLLKHWEKRLIFYSLMYVVASKNHKLADKKNIKSIELQNEMFLARGKSPVIQEIITTTFNVEDPKQIIHINSSNSQLQAVIAELGIAILPHRILALDSQDYSILDVEGFPIEAPFYMVSRKFSLLNNASRKLFEYINNYWLNTIIDN